MTRSFWPGLDGYLGRPKTKKEKTLSTLGNHQRPTATAAKAPELNWEELLGRK